MNTPPPDIPPPDRGDDASAAEFAALLRRMPPRPPPSAWRTEILQTAAATAFTSSIQRPLLPFRRPRISQILTGSMAALWLLSLTLWLETRRLAPKSGTSAASGAAVAAFAPGSLQNEQFRQLLTSLESRSSNRSFSLTRPQP